MQRPCHSCNSNGLWPERSGSRKEERKRRVAKPSGDGAQTRKERERQREKERERTTCQRAKWTICKLIFIAEN